MPELQEGVYTIKNTGRNLVLDLSRNSTDDGNAIIGYAAHGGVNQQVSVLYLHFSVAQFEPFILSGLSKSRVGPPIPTLSKPITVALMAMVSSFRLAL